MGPLQFLQSDRRSFRSAGAVEIRLRLAGARSDSWPRRTSRSPQGDPLTALKQLNADDPRLLRLRGRHHPGPFADRSCARGAARRLPGFRAHHDRRSRGAGASRRATSRAISIIARKIRTARARMRPMPGWRPICRAWAGWASIPPTTCWPANATSAPRSAATMPTCRRRAARSRGSRESELAIAVAVEPTQAPVRHEDFLRVARPMSSPPPTPSMPERLYHQQQQQQQ